MPNHKRYSSTATLSSRFGKRRRHLNHAEEAVTIALADPVGVAGPDEGVDLFCGGELAG